jgi:vancomycin resistance protein YoaR
VGLIGTFAVERFVLSKRVMRGVEVSGVSFTGLERSDAENAVLTVEDVLAKSPQPVRVNGRLLDLAPDKVGFRLDIERTFARALHAGRDKGFAGDFWAWLKRLREPQRVAAEGTVDRTLAMATLDEWEQKMVDVPFSGGIEIEGGKPHAVEPRAGHVIDREAAITALEQHLGNDSRDVVEVPLLPKDAFRVEGAVADAEKRAKKLLGGKVTLLAVGEVSITFDEAELARAFRSQQPAPADPQVVMWFDAKTIDEMLADLRSKLGLKPVDARFFVDGDHVRIVPSRAGAAIDPEAVAEAVLQAAAAPERVGMLPIRRADQPKVTTEDLEALGIDSLVGEYTTHHACCQPRVDNIHRIADLLRGVVVKPGDTFSVNDFVGPRDAKHGFKPAPTIEEGEMVDSPGGGVSQFATTMFNALFLGGYDIVERQPHSYYFSRYPMGRDATLSYPKPDLVFKNDTKVGAMLWTEYDDKSITVKVFGAKSERKVSFKVSPQEDVQKPPIEYIPDITQSPDKEKVKEPGQIGWTVHVTREVRFADGTKREDERKVVYKPRVKRVVVHPCKVPEGAAGYTGEKCPDEQQQDAGVADGG